MGTFMELVSEKQVNPETDKILIIDGGHKSSNVTEMTVTQLLNVQGKIEVLKSLILKAIIS